MNKINIKSYQAIETSFNQDHFDLRFNSTSSFPFGRFLGRMPLSWGKSSLMWKAMAHELNDICVFFSDTWFNGTFNYLDWCPNILLFTQILKPKVINISNQNIFLPPWEIFVIQEKSIHWCCSCSLANLEKQNCICQRKWTPQTYIRLENNKHICCEINTYCKQISHSCNDLEIWSIKLVNYFVTKQNKDKWI